jgi:putative DNA primase/helicase
MKPDNSNPPVPEHARAAKPASNPPVPEQARAAGPAATPATGQPPSGPAAARRPSRVRRACDIEPQTVTFLWHPYLPLGKLSLLDGDPGLGKSWIAAALATAGSRGDGLPGAGAFSPFRTLICTAEDNLSDTLRPRLDQLGADTSLVLLHESLLDLSQSDDFAELEQALEDFQPRLLILDPVVAYLGAKIDTYRANEVRAILAPLGHLAARHGCAILAIRHINKSRGARSLYAGQGSIDFAAAARSVLLAGSSGDDDTERAVVHIKSNLARLGPALAYSVEDQGFRWNGESPLRASDLLAAEATGEDLSTLDEARAFLRSLLASGPVPAADIWSAGREAGLAERTLRRAKQRENITAFRKGYGRGGIWHWSLQPPPGEDEP